MESWDFYRVALGVSVKVCVFVCVLWGGGHLAKQRYRGSRLIMKTNRGAGICLLTAVCVVFHMLIAVCRWEICIFACVFLSSSSSVFFHFKIRSKLLRLS